MSDILDELYDDFALAVMVITDKLRESDSAFVTDLDLDESLADGISATVAANLATTTPGKYVRENINMALKVQRQQYKGGYTASVTWIPGDKIVPTVLACETELEGVWYFYIERDDEE